VDEQVGSNTNLRGQGMGQLRQCLTCSAVTETGQSRQCLKGSRVLVGSRPSSHQALDHVRRIDGRGNRFLSPVLLSHW
jgi:hypothetical protein